MNSSPVLLYLALAVHIAAAILASRRGPTIVLSGLGIALQVLFTVLRTLVTGVLPFASRFEAMALFSLTIFGTGFLLYLITGQRWPKFGTDILGIIILAAALLPVGFHPGNALNPILASPWFSVHILAAFAGYGCFAAGLVWSIVQLFDRRLDFNPAVLPKLALAGLLLLGAGIITGAAWADSSWGRYWSWDPKESWALFTWALMLGFVHIRPGRKLAAAWHVLVFLAMLFTFIGINLLKWGLHRY